MANERMRQPGNFDGSGNPPPTATPEQRLQEMVGTAAAIVNTVIFVGYALVLLLILSGRTVSAAFVPQPQRRRRFETEREVEEEDEDEG
jgi:hypothetical protein